MTQLLLSKLLQNPEIFHIPAKQEVAKDQVTDHYFETAYHIGLHPRSDDDDDEDDDELTTETVITNVTSFYDATNVKNLTKRNSSEFRDIYVS